MLYAIHAGVRFGSNPPANPKTPILAHDGPDIVGLQNLTVYDTLPLPDWTKYLVMYKRPAYPPAEKQETATRPLVPKALRAANLTADQFALTPEALTKLIADNAQEPGIKNLYTAIETITAAVAANLKASG